jgi:uncharacterized protein (UPF0261 family)
LGKTVAVMGAFDTKGTEFEYVKDTIEAAELDVLTIHTGVFEPRLIPDIPNTVVAEAAGASIQDLIAKRDRSYAARIMSEGAVNLIARLFAQGRFNGIISLGGSGGTALAAAAMRGLPLGVPKLIVSTLASGNTAGYVGTSDILMMPSIVDIAGLNSVSRVVLHNAAAAISGMVRSPSTGTATRRPVIAATMYGVTTPCVEFARSYLEEHGFEVLIFHATGIGGQTMEKLVHEGYISGVLDITTTEWCDEVVGGALSAGPKRLEAAGTCGVPQVISVGAMDMATFGPPETVPKRFAGRNFYMHNALMTLMRTTVEENTEIGKTLAKKLNSASSPTAVLLPLNGVSMIDAPGQSFYGPREDQALFEAVRDTLDHSRIELVELPLHINDKEFALHAAKKLIELIEQHK